MAIQKDPGRMMMVNKGHAGLEARLQDYLEKNPSGFSFTYQLVKNLPGEIISVLDVTDDGSGESIRIRYDRLCEWYAKGASVKSIADLIGSLLGRREEPSGRKELRNIYIRLNSELLDPGMLPGIPHKRIGDMMLTYHNRRKHGEYIYRPSTITNEMMKGYYMSRSELHKTALKICREKYPAECLPLADAIGYKQKGGKNPVWVVSDRKGITGAAAILYDGVLDRLQMKIGEKLLIIPSSVHEMIVLPRSMLGEPEMEKILQHENGDQKVINSYEVLSGSLYGYDIRDRELKILCGKEGERGFIQKMAGHNGYGERKHPGRAKAEGR